MIRIGLLGAAGRMGRAIAEVAQAQGLGLAGGIDAAGLVFGQHGDAMALALATDVLIDFTTPAALEHHLDVARVDGGAIVVGTTGLTPAHHALIDGAAKDVAVLQAANMSLGVNLLAALVEQAAARLGPDWDLEVLEMHHRHKRDAPSGTALLLGEAAARGRGIAPGEPVFDRNGKRVEGAIGFASLRGGSVAGDHLVVLATEGERIELGHRAESREIFARGVLKAALWLAGKPAGRYTMADVLGL